METSTLLADGIKTKATVIELLEVSDSDGTSYKPVFEYFDKNDNRISFKNEVSTSPAPYKVGDKVAIIYSKTSEQNKVVSFWGLYRWTIIFLIFACPFLIIGGGYFLYQQ